MNQQGFYPTQPISNQFYPYPAPTYQQPAFQQGQMRQQTPPTQPNDDETMLPIEQSYIENIVRMNKGKNVTIFMTIEGKTKTFEGIIEAAGRDHIIISDPDSGKRYLLLMIYVDYLVFDEKINYAYPLGNSNTLTNSPPR
ncbi:MAG TPA: spore coat protein GerQ [Bacillota bacterium]|nr:spore coat protein GerQ [Bacillota bacterium]